MRKVLKITLYIIGSLLVLLIAAVAWLNTQWGQNFVRTRAEAFLRKKLKTEVHIGHLGYGLPKYVVLDNVFIGDQKNDTLLSVAVLKVDIAMLRLIHKDVAVQQLVLQGVHTHVYRNAHDTDFNFTYIIAAFTGKDTTAKKAKDTTTSSLTIEADTVKLDDIHIRFDDHEGGIVFAMDLAHLDLSMKKMDLNAMSFNIKELNVAGLQGSFRQDTSYLPPTPPTGKKTQLQLAAGNVHLEHIDFQYDDNLNKLLFAIDLGELALQLKKFDLANNSIDIGRLAMNSTSGTLTMGRLSRRPAVVDTIVKKDTTEGWHITAGDIDLSGMAFKLDNQNAPRQKEGIDYQHLDLQGLNMTMHNLYYTSDTINGEMQHLAVKEQSGVDLRELKAKFNYNPQGAILKDLYVLTPHTVIQNYLEVQYPSLAAIQQNMQTMLMRVNLDNTVVGIQDVLIFAPQLRQQELFRKYPRGQVKLAATVYGYLNNLNIARFYLLGMNNTEVSLNGKLRGLPDPEKLSYDLNIVSLKSSRQDVADMVPPAYFTSVRLPDRFVITGKLSGSELDYDPDLFLVSTDGTAYVKGMLAMSDGKNKERYDLMVRTNNLNLGRILKQDSLMGEISAAFTIKGTSFDPKTMNAHVNGAVSAATVKNYRYHDVLLAGDVAAQKGNLSMSVADTNVQFHLLGSADFSGKYAAAKADIILDSIDLQALKLYSSELRARGILHFDFPELNPDYPRGIFTWKQPAIAANGNRFYMDSMYIISRPGADTGQNIVADFDVLHARITGRTPLTKIAAILKERLNRRYVFPVQDSMNATPFGGIAYTNPPPLPKDTTQIPADYDLNITANVIDKPMLHGILPGLTSFDSIHVDAHLTPKNLALNAGIPEVVYGNNSIENGVVTVTGTDSAFTYRATVDKISAAGMDLWFTDLHGNFDKDRISAQLTIADSLKKQRFALAANMTSAGDSQVIQLQKGLMLNYQDWTVAEPNRIVLAKGGMNISNFEISNDGQYIKANSDNASMDAPLKAEISNFQLSNITSIVSSGDTLLANGVLDAHVTIDKMSTAPQIDGIAQIKDLVIMSDTLGNLAARVDNKTAGSLNTRITLLGQGNDIDLSGTYFLTPNNGNEFDLQLQVNALAVHSFETIALKQIRNTTGYLRGTLHVQGNPYSPTLDGTIATDNLATTVSMINSPIKMKSEKITFSGHTISFNNFTVLDSPSNKAVLNGDIDISDVTDIGLDLKLRADNWRAVHSTARDNNTFYGDLFVTTRLDLQGSATSPNIDGNINVLKGTNLTVVTPEKNPELESSKGIVVFVNMKDTARRNLLVPHKEVKKTKKLSPGSSIDVNISVDKAAQFSLIIDQASGDFISVKGDANLNTSISPTGDIGLTGNYELHDGQYQMNYNFIKRKFQIKDGSNITFAGDPIKGTNVDITAEYEAVVPPYELVQRQVNDPAQLNYYKQRLPFDVDLHMRGAVLKPALTFDVTLPDNKVYPLSSDQIELVQGKLSQIRQDTSELNKQVFALLILGRFVSDDPFTSGASEGIGFTALQSVSTFIGEQLNKAAGHFVKGVDLSVDLASTEDYTTGDMRQRTDLNLAASKRLLNDRLKLTIGNDFELEGPQTTNQQTSYIPSNLAADYQLSADGRYTVRGYRRAYDEGVLQGYVTETGLNFIVSLDYNRFKNVLKNKKNKAVSDTIAAK